MLELRSRTAAAARACLAALVLLGATGAPAQEFPSRVIKIVVGFPPGGSHDIVARIFAPRLAEVLGAAVIVENKPGANATIATDFVAKSPADGYTLLLTSASPLVITPHTFDKIPYDTLRDFAGITKIGVTPEAIAVNPSVPAKNLKELAELARTRDVTLASSGNGGMPHLAIERFKAATGGRFIHVPYKGAIPAITDTVGGHVNGVVLDLSSLLAQINAGKLRLLAVTDSERAEVLPEGLSSVEQGFADLVAVNWVGILVPAKTPKAVIDKLHAAFVKIAREPPVREQLLKNAMGPAISESPAAFQHFLEAEFVRWGKVAKESGARSD